jgi:VHL beta domain
MALTEYNSRGALPTSGGAKVKVNMLKPRPMVLLMSVCLSAALVSAAMAATKQNAENFEWMLQKQNGRPVLVFGIRDSDGAQFVATCRSSKRIVVQVATDVSGMANDEEISTGFRGNRFVQSVDSKVIGVDAEFGITGTEFTVSADDSLWPGIIKQAKVRYGVPAMAPSTMEFGEDRERIQDFLDACRNTGGGQQAASPGNGNAGSNNSCSGFGKLKSKNSNRPVTITFVNKTDSLRALMWLDFKGQPQEFGNLEPRQKKTINTFVTHPWMFTDGPGNCQEIYQPQPGDSRFNITKSVISNEAE